MEETKILEEPKKETVIKSWSFLNQISNGNQRNTQTLKNSLIVTNKRLILESNLVDNKSTGTSREEIAIDAIKGVQTKYSTKKPSNAAAAKIVGAIMLLLGLVLLVSAFTADFGGDEAGIITLAGMGSFCVFLGIILLCIKRQSNMMFKLVILSNIFPTNAINITTIINATTQDPSNNITKISPSMKLVFFDPKLAKEIVSTIGELLLVR